MTAEALERIQFYVTNTRRISKIAAQNCHANGHHGIAFAHENEAALADLILADLNTETPDE
jgi:hypothetical protein